MLKYYKKRLASCGNVSKCKADNPLRWTIEANYHLKIEVHHWERYRIKIMYGKNTNRCKVHYPGISIYIIMYYSTWNFIPLSFGIPESHTQEHYSTEEILKIICPYHVNVMLTTTTQWLLQYFGNGYTCTPNPYFVIPRTNISIPQNMLSKLLLEQVFWK